MARSPAVLRQFDVGLRRLPRKLAGLRIAQVSDFHFSNWSRVYECAQSLLKDADYDLLMVTGDVGHWPSKWPEAARLGRRFLEPLAERTPIYAVVGNHDHRDLPGGGQLPVTYLANERKTVKLKGSRIVVAGLEQYSADQGDLDKALGPDDDSGDCTILLAHYPSTIFRLPVGRVDLMLSGHTHGGQIRLPWVGCIWPNDAIPRSMARGLHGVGGTAIHVSAGLGTSLPLRMRVNCPPEIAILTLQPVESDSIEEGEGGATVTVAANAASLD